MEAYPLQWPHHTPRTKRQEYSRFNTSFAKARGNLFKELDLLNATYPVLSMNVPLRRDGLPYAKFKVPEDNGVAVYFSLKGKQMCFTCDRWNCVQDNMQAIRLTIEAMRGLKRWGSSDVVEAAFTGFEALPAPESVNNKPPRSWHEILWLSGMKNITKEKVEFAYRKLAKLYHPDAPEGSHEAFTELQQAKDQALRDIP